MFCILLQPWVSFKSFFSDFISHSFSFNLPLFSSLLFLTVPFTCSYLLTWNFYFLSSIPCPLPHTNVSCHAISVWSYFWSQYIIPSFSFNIFCAFSSSCFLFLTIKVSADILWLNLILCNTFKTKYTMMIYQL